MSQITTVIGFHGTSINYVEKILSEGFKPSNNEYDWLGDGVYFFQDAPGRAWEWARRIHKENAAVIGAKIRLEACIDLLDIRWTSVLSELYDSFLTQMKRSNLELPKQSSGAHRLDRLVINYAVGFLAERETKIRCVRGAFIEGKPIFPDSAIFDRAHVQIAVRDIMLIEKMWAEPQGGRNVINS
ncbi:MAG TPA: hypothetical protein VF721_21680 [Pyrinomonadaceae bacterium]